MSMYSNLSLQVGGNASLTGSFSPNVSFIETELAVGGGSSNANCFLFPSFLYGIIVGVIAYFICSDVYHKIFPKQDDEEEEELFTETVWHNCLETYAVFEYALMFRLGCPSPMFNMNTAWIEIDLMGSTPDGETPIYQPIRLNCKHLKDRICDELSIGIGRITALPTLTGIRAYHNVPQEYIFFYEFILCDLKTNAIPTWCRVNDYITRRPTIFRGLDSHDEEFGLYPELPEMEWSRTELLALGSSGMTFLATFLMLMESFNLYMEPYNSQRGSLVRSLFDVLYALPLILLLIVALLAGYKYTLKKKALQTDYLLEGHDNNLWKYLLWAFNGMVISLAVGCASGTFFLSKTTNLTVSIYWWSSCVIVAVIAGGTWLVAEKSIQIRRLMGGLSEGEEGAVYRKEVTHPIDEPSQQLYIEANSVGTEYSKGKELKQKTANFTMQNEAENMNSYTGTINVGPKMMAPKSNCKNANNLTLQKKNSACRLQKNSNGGGKLQKKQSKRLTRAGARNGRTTSKPKCSKQ